jgi:glycosyltransferase involved in cell wall biosynthesis
MTRVGILAMSRQRNGGTLPYTHSMIEALRLLPPDRFTFVIYTDADNHEYDSSGLPLTRLGRHLSILAAGLFGKDPFHDVDVVIAPIYSMLLLACKRPFAFTLHDLQEHYYPEYFSLATRIWRRLSNSLLTSRAARIICESQFVRKDILRLFPVPADRVVVVPAPPVSTLAQHLPDADSAAAVRRKFGLPQSYVFYPAQFWPHKNHLRLVQAFSPVQRTFPDTHLVLTGAKDLEYNRVFALVRELKLGHCIHHVGHVSQQDLAALYRGATVVAIPTLFESISIPVFEAFALEAPVCASNVVALPEQIGDAGLLFDPTSPDSIASAICKLLGDSALRDQLVANGVRTMSAWTHERYADQLASILDGMREVTPA